MYFVVFILQPRLNIVVPYTWISGVELHLQTFINNGINSNRNFYVFWTNKPEAFDQHGNPRVGYAPNRLADISNNFPSEGWYQCRIRRFHGKHMNYFHNIL